MPDCLTRPRLSTATLPMVSIHVPVRDPSPDRVRGMLDGLARLDYPAFEVLVVDYDTAAPELWEPVAKHCASLGTRFRFFHVGRWPGGRAGALNFARRQTAHRAEFIAVLDDGAVVPRGWPSDAMPAFDDPWIGAVRSPYIVRKDALDGVGGWAEWCVDEAAALDVGLLRRRWRLASPPERTDGPAAGFAAQRQSVVRQAYGAAQIARRHWRPLFSPIDRELTLRQRWRVAAAWLPWATDALGLIVLASSMAISVSLGGAPLRAATLYYFCIVPFTALLALRLRHMAGTGLRAACVGLALSHAAGKAVWCALLNRAPPGPPSGAVREELAMLLLIWTALAGVAHSGLATWPARLWCAMLLVQSLPYLAAVYAAAPAWRPALARNSSAPVARTGAGD